MRASFEILLASIVIGVSENHLMVVPLACSWLGVEVDEQHRDPQEKASRY